jgi:invasion protein IalB
MRLHSKIMGTALAIAAVGASVAFYAAPGDAATQTGAQVVEVIQKADRRPQTLELAQATLAASALPGGASSLNETYRDWQVACVQQATTKRCAFSQSQAQQNGQRVLAIELSAPTENTVAGIVVLPFGLALDKGVTLQIDDKPAGQPLRFRTCLPAGCVVPLSFDAPTLTILRTGVALKVKATGDGGQETAFSISLQGLAAALDRVTALAK